MSYQNVIIGYVGNIPGARDSSINTNTFMDNFQRQKLFAMGYELLMRYVL